MKIKVSSNRKVINLTNLPPQEAKVEYDSLVFGDYHFLDYSFDGESNAQGDEILNSTEIDSLTPIGGNLYASAEGDVYEFIEGDVDDYYNVSGSKKRKHTIVTLGADGINQEDDFYDADGEKKQKGQGKAKLKGFFKKVGTGISKTGKWIGKQAKKFVKFVGKLKPKKGARKLRVQAKKEKRAQKKLAKTKGTTTAPSSQEEKQYLDVIPPVTTDASGKMMKQNPDGTKTEVPKEDVVKAPNGQLIDKKDTQGGELMITKNPETGKSEIAVEIPADQVQNLETESGETIPFKMSDLEENEEQKGLSKGMKTALLIGGGLVVLGLLGFFIYKISSKKGK